MKKDLFKMNVPIHDPQPFPTSEEVIKAVGEKIEEATAKGKSKRLKTLIKEAKKAGEKIIVIANKH